MNLLWIQLRLAKAQFTILALGLLLQRSPAIRLVAVFEKALGRPVAQVVKTTTWVATGMGLFHATAGATGLLSSRNGGSFIADKVVFEDVPVGEEVTLSLRLDGVQVAYWEVDAASDLVDGLDFISDQIPPGSLQGPFERTGGPGGVNNYYRMDSQLLTLSGAPTTPSRIATLEPDGFYSNQNVLRVKAYDSNSESEGGWYEISVEVPLTEPEIAQPPASTRVPTGGRAQFFFESEGIVDDVQWLKDGVELDGETGPTLIVTDVAPTDEGSYTVRISNQGGSTVSAAGVLTIDDAASTELVNLSNRGFVGAGADIMIPGLVVVGGVSKTVLVRGLGPALAASNVPGFLEDPELRVFQLVENGAQLLLSNDDWEDQVGLEELQQVLTDLNKPMDAGSKDAAMLVSLNQGVYTFQLLGVGDSTGVALMELFVVD